MSKLFITSEFYNKLNDDPKVKGVLKLYGYSSRESFLHEVINFLNSKYVKIAYILTIYNFLFSLYLNIG